MKRVYLVVVIVIAVAVMLSAILAAADKPKPKDVSLTGKLVCIGCELKSQYGANAQCSIYGHDHALKTADGKIYTFLPNDKSKDLIAGKAEKNAKVTVVGVVFPGSQIIDVRDAKGLNASSTTSFKCGACGATYNQAGSCCGAPTVAVKQ